MIVRVVFLLTALITGTALVSFTLIAQQIVRSAPALHYLQEMGHDQFVEFIVQTILPLLVTLSRLVLDVMAARVVQWERFINRAKRDAALIQLTVIVQFAFMLFGVFMWYILSGTLIASFFPALSEEIAQKKW